MANPNFVIKTKLIENSQILLGGSQKVKGMICIEEEERMDFDEDEGWEDDLGLGVLGFGLRPDRDCDGGFGGRIVLGVNDEKYYMKWGEKDLRV